MNKKISLGASIAFMAVVASITFCITMLFSQDIFNKMIANVNKREEMYSKIQEIDQVVRDNYLMTIDEETLLDSLGDGMVAGLNDQYARYLDKEEYAQKQKEDKGELVGIGIQVKAETTNNYMTISNVYPGSPAEQAGVQKNDLIVKIEGNDVAEMTFQDAAKKIKGEAGSKITLTIRRAGLDTDYEIPRKDIIVPTVFSKMVGKNGVIRITEFNSATVEQFKTQLDSLMGQGVTGLIFDLRNNPGGTLDSVSKILDILLPEGVITTSTDSKGENKTIASSDAAEVNLPMVTITNGSTASAAELFVIALKDYQKGGSVGTNTYGKGVMQTTEPLSDGSAIVITTAYFNPPVSENFNGVGIKPDYEVTLTKEQEQNLEVLDESSDSQLAKAVEVVNSKQ